MDVNELIKNVKYLLEKVDSGEINAGEKGTDTLLDAIRLVKYQIAISIATDAISNSPLIAKEIAQARKSVNDEYRSVCKKLAELQKNNPEFGDRQDGRTKRQQEEMRMYEEEKAILESQIERLKEMNSSLSKGRVEEFVKGLCPGDESREWEQALIDTCATNMAHGYMSMQTVGGEPLFEHKGNSYWKGYIPNNDKIGEFLNLISDSKDFADVNNIRMLEKEKEKLKAKENKVKEDIVKESELLESIHTPEFEELSANMSKIAALVDEVSALDASQVPATIDTNKNVFSKLFDKIKNTLHIGKKVEQPKSIKELNKLVEEHRNRLENDEAYKKAYGTYETLQKRLEHDEREKFFDLTRKDDGVKGKILECRDKGVEIYTSTGKAAFFATDIPKVEERIKESREKLVKESDVISNEITTYENVMETAISNLSPQAREFHERATPQEIDDIRKKYFEPNTRARYGVTPPTAALTLNVLTQDRTEDVLCKLEEVIGIEETFDVNLCAYEAEKKVSEFVKGLKKEISDMHRD